MYAQRHNSSVGTTVWLTAEQGGHRSDCPVCHIIFSVIEQILPLGSNPANSVAETLRKSSDLTLSRSFLSHDSTLCPLQPLLHPSLMSPSWQCKKNLMKVLLTSEDSAGSPGRTSSCALVVASSSLRFPLPSLKEPRRPALKAWTGVQLCSLFELFGRTPTPSPPPSLHDISAASTHFRGWCSLVETGGEAFIWERFWLNTV